MRRRCQVKLPGGGGIRFVLTPHGCHVEIRQTSGLTASVTIPVHRLDDLADAIDDMAEIAEADRSVRAQIGSRQ